MKKEKWIIPLIAGVGAAAIVYALWPENKIPDEAIVKPFDLERYMGDWNEVARLPNMLEKDVTRLIESYGMMGDKEFSVLTKAYKAKTGKWNEFSGNARFAGAKNIGRLEVSYLGPLYLDYNVLDLDDDYKYALVSGSSLNYLWILSKEESVPDEIKERFLAKAKHIGFAVEKLEWV